MISFSSFVFLFYVIYMKSSVLQSSILKLMYTGICRNFLTIFSKVHFDKQIRTELKGFSQYIIVANHTSHLDTVSLLASLPANHLYKIKSVAAEDYFGNTKIKRWLSNYFINTLLIRRKGTKEERNDAIRKMIDALDQGYSLLIYPEGSRKHGGEMKEIKSGIAHLLSSRPQIPYIPVYLKGMNSLISKSKSSKIILWGKITYMNKSEIKDIIDNIRLDFDELTSKANSI